MALRESASGVGMPAMTVYAVEIPNTPVAGPRRAFLSFPDQPGVDGYMFACTEHATSATTAQVDCKETGRQPKLIPHPSMGVSN